MPLSLSTDLAGAPGFGLEQDWHGRARDTVAILLSLVLL